MSLPFPASRGFQGSLAHGAFHSGIMPTSASVLPCQTLALLPLYDNHGPTQITGTIALSRDP